MTIKVNGETHDVADGTTISALLGNLNLPTDSTVAERNGEIVERADYDKATLAEGDVLELLSFVGGG